jgi:hypothetical protein
MDQDGQISGYTENMNIPQVIGKVVETEEECLNIFLDPAVSAEMLEKVKSGKNPVVYVMNPPGLEAWAELLGGRIPKDNNEQYSIFEALTDESFIDKMIKLQLPCIHMYSDYDHAFDPMEKAVALVSSQRIGRDDGLSWIGKCETLYAIVESNPTMSYV